MKTGDSAFLLIWGSAIVLIPVCFFVKHFWIAPTIMSCWAYFLSNKLNFGRFIR